MAPALELGGEDIRPIYFLCGISPLFLLRPRHCYLAIYSIIRCKRNNEGWVDGYFLYEVTVCSTYEERINRIQHRMNIKNLI